MFDRNGLQLTTAQSNTMNTYRLTAVDLTIKKYSACAYASKPKGKSQWAMFKIGTMFKDPRDAAYIAQEFSKQYTPEQIRQMVTDDTFKEVSNQFVEDTEIPDWKFPAEGLLVEDILNDYGYKTNYVPDSKAALREVINVFGLETPALKKVPGLVAEVEALYNKGVTYREAARQVMGVEVEEGEIA